MPIYECHCLPCDLTFEVLAPVSKAQKEHACPDCGRPSRRIVSAFAIASSQGPSKEQQTIGRAQVKKDPRPLCLQYPHLPLLCHMDNIAARRWVAYSKGRGHEFDDKLAQKQERRKQLGEQPITATQEHGHAHNFRRHSPAKADSRAHGAGLHQAEGGHSHLNPGHTRSHSHSDTDSHSHSDGHDKPHNPAHHGGHAHQH